MRDQKHRRDRPARNLSFVAPTVAKLHLDRNAGGRDKLCLQLGDQAPSPRQHSTHAKPSALSLRLWAPIKTTLLCRARFSARPSATETNSPPREMPCSPKPVAEKSAAPPEQRKLPARQEHLVDPANTQARNSAASPSNRIGNYPADPARSRLSNSARDTSRSTLKSPWLKLQPCGSISGPRAALTAPYRPGRADTPPSSLIRRIRSRSPFQGEFAALATPSISRRTRGVRISESRLPTARMLKK